MRLLFARLILASILAGSLLISPAVLPQAISAPTKAFLSPPAPAAASKDTSGLQKFKPCVEKEKDRGDDKDNGNDKKRCFHGGSSSGIARADFNGDGFADLAIGVPDEDLNGVEQAGAVHIIYGAAAGLSATAGPGDQFFTQANLGGLGVSVASDSFGAALAAGDFNGDGKSDLAVGTPGDDPLGISNGGVVYVLYGSSNGLTAVGGQFFIQGFDGLLDAAESGDRFGATLSWGDFDGDGFGDLAVGVPDEDVGSVSQAGAVHVIYGSGAGLTVVRNQFWSQDSTGILERAEAFDFFGASLVAGDFNGDGRSDLAVGVVQESVAVPFGFGGATNVQSAGAVNVLYGSSLGLVETFNQFWSQESAEGSVAVLDAPEAGDRFGFRLAAGDFNGDGRSDLAVGVHSEDVIVPLTSTTNIIVRDAGAVNVLYGSSARGLTATGNQFWTQNSEQVLDNPEEGDNFGLSLAAGDFNGDGRSDLAVGVPLEDVGSVGRAGAVNIINGSSSGLRAFSLKAGVVILENQFITQNTSGVEDTAEENDSFGSTLTAWNFGNGAPTDLAIGVPGEDVGAISAAGAVNVLYGSIQANGLTTIGDQLWTQDTPGIEDQAEAFDEFGDTLY